MKRARVKLPIKARVIAGLPPRASAEGVVMRLVVKSMPVEAVSAGRIRISIQHLGSSPPPTSSHECVAWLWSDRSATGAVQDGGPRGVAGRPPDFREAASRICSNYRAEMFARASKGPQIPPLEGGLHRTASRWSPPSSGGRCGPFEACMYVCMYVLT